MPAALIVGNDSEIGTLVAKSLRSSDWKVYATSRRQESVAFSPEANLYFCDLVDRESISLATSSFVRDCPDWNLVVLSVGTLNPIGRIIDTNFDEWEKSIQVNFLNQLFFISEVLRKTDLTPNLRRTILTFAGSGTNSAPVNFSAYTLSKVALIKATELLAAEYQDCAFVSLGTGWIRSAIHNQTLDAGYTAGSAYKETVRRMREGDFGDPNLLCEFILWMNSQPIRSISGLNFALQGDDWKAPTFCDRISEVPNNFKLRRLG
jgi:NAD(P)-dependent dehydrogenase (short-subunit alcohol dehydrogenase family)